MKVAEDANIIAMAKVVNDDTAGITEVEKTKNASGEEQTTLGV